MFFLWVVIGVVMIFGFHLIQKIMWGKDFSGIVVALVSGLYILVCLGIIGKIIKALN